MAGSCEYLVDLLRYMCAKESKPEELFQWVIRWLAYPIQHPGAKMQTTIVVHGPQGTGKNMFFEAIMGIYGRYGRIIDQSAIEDKFNDWASRSKGCNGYRGLCRRGQSPRFLCGRSGGLGGLTTRGG